MCPPARIAGRTVEIDFEGKIVGALQGAETKFNKQDR
jgi:hypothetical protein